MNNPNCDGGGPCKPGEVRKLPYGSSGGNLILCRNCYEKEIAWRKEANQRYRDAFSRDDTPAWDTLAVVEKEA